LKTEREAEVVSSGAARAVGKLPVPMSGPMIMVGIVLIALLITMVVLVNFFGHHGPTH
jgi:hypothetical protein